MIWEAIAGIAAIVATFVSVFTVAVRINRTLVLLEAAVDRLGKLTEAQSEKLASVEQGIGECDRRILLLEARTNEKGRKYSYES